MSANNVNPDQMPHYVASDLDLHCSPITLLQVSRLQCVQRIFSKDCCCHLFLYSLTFQDLKSHRIPMMFPEPEKEHALNSCAGFH